VVGGLHSGDALRLLAARGNLNRSCFRPLNFAPLKSPTSAPPDLRVQLGPLALPNPIVAASGTFGYAREMERLVDLSRLGGIVPKTVTRQPRIGNAPWRTIETPAGMLNSIGLDNDGIDAFLAHHLPYLAGVGAPIIVSIAGRTEEEFVEMSAEVGAARGAAAVELNISCPNVSGGVDFGTSLTCASGWWRDAARRVRCRSSPN
jgi:dihydroorotate dehydrogenase (NAD+) catalytic subunit